QCRWSYDSDLRVREIAQTFRKKGIPCDVIWMDIDYMDGFRCFTFDQETFPNPKSLADDLHEVDQKKTFGCKQQMGSHSLVRSSN
nr:heteroglycan glucosidase 1 [Tanacetum cinerariifolium]